MTELLAMLGGGLFRLLPFVVDFFKQRREADHEYRMTQLQLQIDQARAAQQIDLAHAHAAIARDAGEMQAFVEAVHAEAQPSGVPWADALSRTVRPVLTYYWCVGVYGTAKALQIYLLLSAGGGAAQLLEGGLITEFDRQVIASMLAFWFVDRALRRMEGR